MSKHLQFNPYFQKEIAPAQTEHWKAKRRVADAMRELNEMLVTSMPEADELDAIAARLEHTAEMFSNTKRIYGRHSYARAGEFADMGEAMHEIGPLGGRANPIAPPLNMWVDGDRVYGKANLGWAYEGPPGCVHGGFVAAIFDDFTGMAQVLGNQPGMTGTLSVRYLRPTPLNTDLDLEAWLDRVDGRKTSVVAEIRHDDITTARCEALFIRPREAPEELVPKE